MKNRIVVLSVMNDCLKKNAGISENRGIVYQVSKT